MSLRLMKRFGLVVFLLFIIAISAKGAERYSLGSRSKQDIYPFVQVSQTLTVDSVSIQSLIAKNSFQIPNTYLYYKSFSDSTYWLKIPLVNNEKHATTGRLVIKNAYLQSGDVWIERADGSLEEGIHFDCYRLPDMPRNAHFPVWSFKLLPNEEVNAYVRIIDRETRTCLMIGVYGEDEYARFMATELAVIVGYSAFILLIAIIIAILAFAKRERAMLLYPIYLVFFVIDNAAIKGFGQNYIWYDIEFLTNNIRSISHGFIMFFGSLFYAYFYRRYGIGKGSIRYFRWFALSLVPFFIVYAVKIFYDPFPDFYRYFWNYLNINLVIMLLIHIYLAVRKRLPVYLAVAFALPIIGSQVRNHFVPHYGMPEWIGILVNNSYFLAVGLEVSLVSYFVIREIYRQSNRHHEVLGQLRALEMDKQHLHAQLKRSQEKNNMLLLRSKATLNANDVLYVKSDGHYLEYFVDGRPRPEIDRNSIREVEDELVGLGFIRIHRSYIVNLQKIKCIYSTKVLLQNGEEIPVSRKLAASLQESLN